MIGAPDHPSQGKKYAPLSVTQYTRSACYAVGEHALPNLYRNQT
jgi:hypothetical protein